MVSSRVSWLWGEGVSTHKVLFHKLQLVVLAVFAFLVGELVLVRGALTGMIVAVALPVPNLPVPVAAEPLWVASLMMVVAVRGTARGSMPARCFFPTWASSQPAVPSFGNARVYRVMPQKQGGLLPAIAFGETCENKISPLFYIKLKVFARRVWKSIFNNDITTQHLVTDEINTYFGGFTIKTTNNSASSK